MTALTSPLLPSYRLMPSRILTRARGYVVLPVDFKTARAFVAQHHYARGMHNGPTALFGLWDGPSLLGVVAFATPCSEAVRSSVFGPDHKGRVTELSRVVLIDEAPHNSESFFVSRALRLLKESRPDIWAVVSFADTAHGHVGTIYQASNLWYAGRSKSAQHFIDTEGRIRHRRQCGTNITTAEALARGWTPGRSGIKHRYIASLPDDKRHERHLSELLLLSRITPYPKLGYMAGRSEKGLSQ